MSKATDSNREYFRFKWSHRHPFHQALVRIYNAVMRRVPFGLKYGVGKRVRRNKPPYSLVGDGSVVVQVGAPKDTLRAGRSRGMYLSLMTGPGGKVVIVEPDADSAADFGAALKRAGIRHVTVCPLAAWSEKTTLHLRVNPAHPATNFVEGCADYTPEQVQTFQQFEIPADTLDNILDSQGVGKVDLVSITTNGAEERILEGMRNTIASGVRYISLARTGDYYADWMAKLGYDFIAHDDRGYTFEKRRAVRESVLQAGE